MPCAVSPHGVFILPLALLSFLPAASCLPLFAYTQLPTVAEPLFQLVLCQYKLGRNSSPNTARWYLFWFWLNLQSNQLWPELRITCDTTMVMFIKINNQLFEALCLSRAMGMGETQHFLYQSEILHQVNRGFEDVAFNLTRFLLSSENLHSISDINQLEFSANIVLISELQFALFLKALSITKSE